MNRVEAKVATNWQQRQSKLTEYLTTRKSELMAKLAKEKALSDALTAELKAAVLEFKQTYS